MEGLDIKKAIQGLNDENISVVLDLLNLIKH